MTDPDRLAISRRGFLLGAAGLAVSAGCSGGSKKEIAATNGSPTTAKKGAPAPINVTTPGSTNPAADQLNLGVITALMVSGVDQRVAFVLQGQSGFVTPDASATFALGPDDKHLAALPISVHGDAAPAAAYLATTHRFDAPGVYVARVALNGKHADAALQVVDPASEPSPLPGRPIPNIATPTTANLMGNDAALLCTRSPVCPWHDLSLDKALAAGRPLAVYFGTPKFCQTQTCGPTLEALLRQKAAFEGKIQFLHLEIYRHIPANLPAGQLPPPTATVDAFKISSEPVLFLVTPDGKVQQRIDGLFGDAEAKDALTRFTA